MLTTVAVWLPCLGVGVALQRRLHDPQRASHLLFLVVLWVVAPLVVIYAYTTVVVRAELVAAFAAVVTASWVTLMLGVVWGRLVGRDRRECGLLSIATCMGNTASVGYPLATIVFGGPGLALAVIYAEFQFLIPVEGVIFGLARHYAGPQSRGTPAPGVKRLLRTWFLNPPVVAGACAVALRLLGADIRALVAPIGPFTGIAAGMIGFAQLGLATPLTPVAHDRTKLWRALITLLLRCALAPLILLSLGLILHVHIPGVFLLLAAMPVAFNTMVVSAVFDLDAELARLLIAVSTPLVIAAVLIWQMA